MLKCYLNTEKTWNRTEQVTCTASDLAGSLTDILHIYYQILTSMVGPSLTLDEITYEDCESKFR